MRKNKFTENIINYKKEHKNLNLIVYIQSYGENIIEELLTSSESETFHSLIEFTKQIEVIVKYHAPNIISTQNTIAIEPLTPYNIKNLTHADRKSLLIRIEKTRKTITENGLKYDKIANNSTITKFLSLHAVINFQTKPTENMNKYVDIITKFTPRNERISEEQIQILKELIPELFSKERNCQLKKNVTGNILIQLCKRKQQSILKYDPDSLKTIDRTLQFAQNYDQISNNQQKTESIKRENSEEEIKINLDPRERFQEDLEQIRLEIKNEINHVIQRMDEIEDENISIRTDVSGIKRDFYKANSPTSNSDNSSSDDEDSRKKRKRR